MNDRTPSALKLLTADHFRHAAREWPAHRLRFGHANKWEVLIDGDRFPPKGITQLAYELAGLGSLGHSEFTGKAAHGYLHSILRRLAFEVVPKPRELEAQALADSVVLTPEAVRAAARLWHEQSSDYHRSHGSYTREVLIDEERYPPRPICQLALAHLGLPPLAPWGASNGLNPWYQRLEDLGFPFVPKPSQQEAELEAFVERTDIPTEVRREAVVRLTQGAFRKSLIEHRGEQCDVTGVLEGRVLRASHIQRWADSAEEPFARRDPANGLLLAAHLDCLFEHGLIAFAEDGRILISHQLEEEDRKTLGIHPGLRLRFIPSARQQAYLAKHRARTSRMRESR